VELEHSDWRRCFTLACSALVELVDRVEPEQLEAPGLGVWTIRDLIGHASRAMTTIETYLQDVADDHSIGDAVSYYLSLPTSYANPDAIAQRGREAGAALGDDPASALRAISSRVRQIVDATSDDVSLLRPSISFGAYLPTRVFELTVHSLDLAAALGSDPPDTLDEPVAATLQLASAVAARTESAAQVLLALTGRSPLPEGYSVV
jgi:uncharacterized protein (TIGR03083 family)